MEVTVYILRCRDGAYYTGLTKQNIEARVWEHNAGVYDGYTAKRPSNSSSPRPTTASSMLLPENARSKAGRGGRRKR
jgi:hypothetical protein